jgi:tetratricopeptide (TPR) repeat protein
LPPVQQLLQQSEEACKSFEKSTGEQAAWPLAEVAKAKACADDYAGAMRIAQTLPSFWKYATLTTCWEIHFQQSGTVADVPLQTSGESEIEKALDAHMRTEMAKVLVAAGRLTEATKLLPQEHGSPGTADDLTEFYVFLARDHIRRGDRQRAGTAIRSAWAISERAEARRNRVEVSLARCEGIEAVVKLWIQLGDREQARAATDAATKRVSDWNDTGKPSTSLALAWAWVGKLHALLGHDRTAAKAFRRALQVANTADQDRREDDFRTEEMRAQDRVRALGRIGAWQFAAGRKDEAADTYKKAIEGARQVRDGQGHDSVLLTILESQAKEGDIRGALQTLEQIQDAYWKALGYCRCAEKLTAAGPSRLAQELLQKAETLADAVREPRNITGIFEKIATAHARAGCLPAAKRCLAKALAVSRNAKDQPYHQGIARCQIRIGLLEDAYETIQAMQDRPEHLLPLAELAHQASKRQALGRQGTLRK